MGKQPAPIGFGEELENVNLSDWEPKPKEKMPAPVISEEKVREIATSSGFGSREAKPEKSQNKLRVQRRRHRTGRSEQINIKARSMDIEDFYRICNERDWVLGYTFQRALEALNRELKQEKAGAKK